MVFSSLIFLCKFLPIMIVGYYIINDKFKNIFLLFGSLFFYAWGEPKYILLMIFSIVINWGIGLLMDKFTKYKKSLLIIDILINLGLLGYFKYFNFFIRTLNKVSGKDILSSEIALPIGISFFTFQIISYIVDLYHGQYRAQKNIINLALYISFFPQLIAGPIVKYKDIDKQLNDRICTLEKMGGVYAGLYTGLAKRL